MTANFHINYGTKPGEQIAIQFLRNNTEHFIICQSFDTVNWQGVLQISEN